MLAPQRRRSDPNSVSTLLGFLFLVAPGVSYEIRRERRRPALQNSAFREAARIALWSLVFMTPTVVALALLSSVFPTHLPDVLAWSAQGKDYAKQFSSQIASFLLAEVVVAQMFCDCHRCRRRPAGSWRDQARRHLAQGIRCQPPP
jgi:cytochrome c biogenesis factor